MKFEIDSNREEVEAALKAATEAALDAVGMQAATLSKRELQNDPARIDTGLLRNSITWALGGEPAAISSYKADKPKKQKLTRSIFGAEATYTATVTGEGQYSGSAPQDSDGERSVYIGSNVSYCIYVHDGTDRMAPNRFIKNGILNNRAELSEIMEKTFKNA